MPGKKAPDYYPLNLNMSGIGKGSYYGDMSPVQSAHHGKFDNSGLGMIMGSPINTLTNNSPNTNSFSLSEYIAINGVPPVNSEDEDEDEDDIVSHSGSESVSIQGSDDLDVDIDDVDSLVLSIRDKLQMAPNGSGAPSHHWTSVSEMRDCGSPSGGNETNDLLIHQLHHSHHLRTSPLSFPNNGSMNTSGSSDNSTSCNRRRKNHPYSQFRASINFSQYHRKQSSNSSSSSSPGGTNAGSSSGGSLNNMGHNNYYRRFHSKQSGSIEKAKYKNWRMSGGCTSSSSITKQLSRTDDPYLLLKELLESGSLIKEAVRRLNRKCLNSSNGNNTISNPPPRTTPGNSISASVICTNSSSNSATVSTNCSNSNTRFSFMVDEDTENSCPVIPVINQ